jgi:diguanylate cyclase (GGDEF)-like protein
MLAGVLVGLALFFQWKIADDALRYSRQQMQYQQALEAYRERNIYYSPADTVRWIVLRQNPAGYFVPNPDMLFEPSQLNEGTLRGTRYAISTLRDLNALSAINRRAVAEYVLKLYRPRLDREYPDATGNREAAGAFAGFANLPGAGPGVRPTMDALIILDALDLLDDSRLDLPAIWNFIMAHQNADGGFWDEHYPKYGRASSMKVTSFAARALGILHRRLEKPFSRDFSERVRAYIQSLADPEKGGFRGMAGKPANDAYNAFRAFISIFETTNGGEAEKRRAVEDSIDVDALMAHLKTMHYLSGSGAFSRFPVTERQQPSLKATHLVVWLARDMGRLSGLDTHAISKYVTLLQSAQGQYGGDIYTTYSAIGVLQKLGVPSHPLPPPEKPEKLDTIPGYVPAVFFLAALLVLLVGHQAKKLELQNINRALSLQASIDNLTGIFNRQKFEALLREERERHARYGHPLSLVMFDVDNFKSINDEKGHLVGDQILREVTAVIQGALRHADVFARWGGEEFIIMLPETERAGAYQLAEKLRKLLEDSRFSEDLRVTASFGVTELLRDDDLDDLVERADMAMLFAKAQGKNRVYSVVSDVQAELMSTSCA